MDRKPSPSEMLVALPSAAAEALHFPPGNEFPPVDQRLVPPESREEMVRGRRVLALPAEPPHADRHCELDYVVRAHVVPGYIGSSDMLTRSAEKSDFATDTSVRKEGIDASTGKRYLEELAFEVVHTQTLKDITIRAEDLAARGVRRIFAIFVKKGEVKEWEPAARSWQLLDADASITDRCLIRPLRVKALLNAADADNEVARALLKKDNPVLEALKHDSMEKGVEQGIEQGIEQSLARLFEKRLARALSLPERKVLAERLQRLGEDRLDDVLLSLSPSALAAWLAEAGAL